MRRPIALLASLSIAAGMAVSTPAAAQAPPTTGFEDSNGANWTSHDEEVAFLAAVAAASPRVEIDVIAETLEGRPMHLVRIGDPVPHSLAAAQDMPVEFHMCSQHGNEPAGREACLQTIRDLAFTDDATLIEQMQQQVTLYIPAANPDGREANQRENSIGVDLNRNHLQVEQIETRAIGRVVRDWKPVMNMDHHEYGPIIPALYDDDVLYLWPRNLNVYGPLRDLAKEFAVDHLEPCLEAQLYRADEYGQYSVGEGQEVGEQPVPDLDLQQTAGDEDDGISRNAGGLRHSLGILVESFVPDLVNADGPTAIPFRTRRVSAQVAVIGCTMEWMRNFGDIGFDTTRESMAAKAAEGADRSAPVFFNGQDEDTTVTGSGEATSTSFADPPPCGYLVDANDVFEEFEEAVDVHDLTTAPQPSGDVFVTMAQTAEPVVGLLLDARGSRHLIEAEPLDDCAAYAGASVVTPTPEPEPTPAPTPEPAPTPLPVTGGGLVALALLGLASGVGLRRR